MRTTISTKLMQTLFDGKKRLGGEALRRLSNFVESQKTAEDAFINKSGEVDLYYTSFGWLLSYVLGIELNGEKRRIYLENQPVMSLDLVHYAAYMRCVLLHRLMKEGMLRFLLSAMRPISVRSLSSFTDLPHKDIWSPYTRFIWMSLLEDTRNKEKEKTEVLKELGHYHVKGGGFSNLRNREVATTNATVAALAIIGQLEGYKPIDDLFYLRDTQDETGGFKVGQGAPVPDLLSTATALFLMRCYGIRPVRAANDFIEAHWLDSGGFSATLLEDSGDVEYVFYGLLALGAL